VHLKHTERIEGAEKSMRWIQFFPQVGRAWGSYHWREGRVQSDVAQDQKVEEMPD
jgi:hypothetical protein